MPPSKIMQVIKSISAHSSPAKCLLISVLPLDEPVAHGGSFVMNTREEILLANRDFE